jgi:hypothetical protein
MNKSTKLLTDDYRRMLLKDLTDLKSGDRDLRSNPSLFFVMDFHKSAASRNAMIVSGPRRSGKTALFNFLLDSRGDQEAMNDIGIGSCVLVEGFSTEMFTASNLSFFARFSDEEQCKSLWLALICIRIANQLKSTRLMNISHEFHIDNTSNPELLSRLGKVYVQELTSWLMEIDEECKCSIIVMYDNIEMVDADVKDKMIFSLLTVWSRIVKEFKSIRPKFFINTHIIESFFRVNGELCRFFLPGMVSIKWDRKQLYRLLKKRMLNASNEVKEWLSPAMSEDVNFLASHLAGKSVYTGTRKQLMHSWIMNRLQDSHGNVSPGAIIQFIENAAKVALAHGPMANGDNLLHPDELRGALVETSGQQLRAIVKGFLEIRTLASLVGYNAAIKGNVALDRIGNYQRNVGSSVTANTVLENLIMQGIASGRSGVIDFADIYCYSFDMKRSSLNFIA